MSVPQFINDNTKDALATEVVLEIRKQVDDADKVIRQIFERSPSVVQIVLYPSTVWLVCVIQATQNEPLELKALGYNVEQALQSILNEFMKVRKTR